MPKKKIAVAVSGGADSLYSLLALKNAGNEVLALHGLFLPEHLRPAGLARMLESLTDFCTAQGVPLHILDLSASFENLVIRPFVHAYLKGQTPNPCAWCNQRVKFGLLLDTARQLGAEHLATGHYARLRELDDGLALLAGEDETKDQSYFLACTPFERLSKAVFPMGELRKREILAELAARGVEVPQKTESQEICFIPDNDYRAFLRSCCENAPAALCSGPLPGPGPVALPDGQVIARHKGLWNYTQGQRRGLEIAWSEPLYVLGKDVASNTLLVGPASAFQPECCLCREWNLLVPCAAWPQEIWAKTRYRQKLRPVRWSFTDKNGESMLRLEFSLGENAAPPAPGQVAALYTSSALGLRLLAGAVICSSNE